MPLRTENCVHVPLHYARVGQSLSYPVEPKYRHDDGHDG